MVAEGALLPALGDWRREPDEKHRVTGCGVERHQPLSATRNLLFQVAGGFSVVLPDKAAIGGLLRRIFFERAFAMGSNTPRPAGGSASTSISPAVCHWPMISQVSLSSISSMNFALLRMVTTPRYVRVRGGQFAAP